VKKMVRISQLKTKTELLDLIPRPSTVEYNLLKESIKKFGQKEPIIVNQNYFVIDGYTRLSICEDLRKNPKITVKRFKSYDEEMDYVITSNLHRRHLNDFQKSEIFFIPYKKRTSIGKLPQQKHQLKGINSSVYFSKKAGINKEKFVKAIYILDNGSPTIINHCREGKTSIHKAFFYLKNLIRGNKIPDNVDIRYKDQLTCPTCHRVLPKDIQDLSQLELKSKSALPILVKNNENSNY